MRPPFEDAVRWELSWLLRAGVQPRALRITVRELVVAQIGRGPLGAHEVEDAVAAVARAACRLVRELDAPEDVVEIVCRAALEAVRGHGGRTAQWLDEAAIAMDQALGQFDLDRRGRSAHGIR
jgi:hypothetical protein